MAAPAILCLYCFRSIAPRSLNFRCMMPTCKGRAPDAVYAEARGYGADVIVRLLTPLSATLACASPQKASCGGCQETSYSLTCPHCHFELPYDIGQIDQRIIAVIGARATGKTHYLATLISGLQHGIGKT